MDRIHGPAAPEFLNAWDIQHTLRGGACTGRCQVCLAGLGMGAAALRLAGGLPSVLLQALHNKAANKQGRGHAAGTQRQRVAAGGRRGAKGSTG